MGKQASLCGDLAGTHVFHVLILALMLGGGWLYRRADEAVHITIPLLVTQHILYVGCFIKN
jgi:hypothetical protein